MENKSKDTKGDLANISAFKALINMLSNDIEDVKKSNKPASQKLDEVWEISRRRIDLIANATKHYPEVNFISECVGLKTAFDESIITTARMKVLDKYNLN